MLNGIDPLLVGPLLAHLDLMGHGDTVAVVDAHFPAERVGRAVVLLPGVAAPAVVRAICSVLPLDTFEPPVGLMARPDPGLSQVQHELCAAAGIFEDQARLLKRFAFYEAAATAAIVVRTGETRTYGNTILRKGLVQDGAT